MPKPDPPLVGQLGLAVAHPPLDLGSTADRIDYARELHQQAVARVLYDPAPMLFDLRIDQFAQMRLEAFVRSFLVRSHQARIARHIGGENGGQPAFDAFQGETAPNRVGRTGYRLSGLILTVNAEAGILFWRGTVHPVKGVAVQLAPEDFGFAWAHPGAKGGPQRKRIVKPKVYCVHGASGEQRSGTNSAASPIRTCSPPSSVHAVTSRQ